MNERENTARKPALYDENDQANVDPRLVNTDFVENQSLSAKGFDPDRKRKALNDETFDAEAQNDDRFEQIERVVAEETQYRAREAILQRQAALKGQHSRKVAGRGKGVTSLVRWTGLGIAGVSYMWQFTCAAISLMGIGAWTARDYALTENIVGSTINKVVGFFGIDLAKLFPVEYFFYIFWGLATLIALTTFFVFLLWFFFTGIRVFNTPVSALVTALTFACSMLPVANLFPWVLIWVIAMNAGSTLSYTKNLLKAKGN